MTCKMTSTKVYASFAELEDKFWFQREPIAFVKNDGPCRVKQQKRVYWNVEMQWFIKKKATFQILKMYELLEMRAST